MVAHNRSLRCIRIRVRHRWRTDAGKRWLTNPGILRAATQYGVRERILDLCTFDITRNPWRCGGLFDAIITDPPCKR
ncbi:hypothetical protein EDB85DRAFT_1974269 [Lactarius pseudohatsudake]|nr:hypothetical protein EDB85DRAFT_1974269 [Lactarius pseudohatsudake]